MPNIRAKARSHAGNMLILVTAVVVGIVIFLLIFGVSFVRLLGTNSEQRTAIEAAATAAARDISRIVINTPEFGYVSISDYAPNGTATAAADGYSLPVRSINTIIGTARLDLIIADQLNQPLMEDLAKKDMQNALLVKDQLVAALQAAIAPGGAAQDKDGNSVTPYASAETAYQQNQIRMSGSSSYVAGSMQLSLGSILGGVGTRIPLPEPQAVAPVPASGRVGNFYRSFVNVPYGGVDFVFGGIGDVIKIVDHKNWRATIPALPYQIPTIVRAEAVQKIRDVHNQSGMDVSTVACAQPATVHDPLPAPGALSISFPDGPVPEISQPHHCYSNAKMNGGGGSSTALLLTAKVGDYPMDPGSNMSPMPWPLGGGVTDETPADVWRVHLFDWIRRAGTKANITSVVNMQATVLDLPTPATRSWIAPINFNGPYQLLGTIPSGIIHIFKFASDGVVTYQSKPLTPLPLYASSNEQMHGEALKGIKDSSIGKQDINLPMTGEVRLDNDWDIYFRDEVRQPGTILGGKHAGEPLAKPIVAMGRNAEPIIVRLEQRMYRPPFPAISGDGGGPPPPSPYPGPVNPPVPGPNKGFPPMIQPRNDFGVTYNPAAPLVLTMPGGTGHRPFYETTGTAVDIRFRRVVDIRGLPGASSDFGYISIVAP